MIDLQLNFRMYAFQHTIEIHVEYYSEEKMLEKISPACEHACITKHVHSCEHVCVGVGVG